jgi:carbamoyl-phosphate synthase large subunit
VPCVTTTQGLAACVHGIEATINGEVGVRSLQDHHAFLRRGAPGTPYGEGDRAASEEVR